MARSPLAGPRRTAASSAGSPACLPWAHVISAAAARGERVLTMILAEPEAVAAARTSQSLAGAPARWRPGGPVQGTGRLRSGMERQKWLAERRAALAAAYDAEAATYDDERHPWDMQREWVARVLGLIPPGGTVLDAPCGTGKYFAMLTAAGRGSRALTSRRACWPGPGRGASHSPSAHIAAGSVVCGPVQRGSDHRGDAAYPARRLARRAGQSGPGCPAGWPGVPDGPGTGAAPYPAGLRVRGLPAVRGELAEEDTPGYHYFPGRDQAAGWLGQQGLAIVDEGFRRGNDWGHHHFLLRPGPASPAS